MEVTELIAVHLIGSKELLSTLDFTWSGCCQTNCTQKCPFAVICQLESILICRLRLNGPLKSAFFVEPRDWAEVVFQDFPEVGSVVLI